MGHHSAAFTLDNYGHLFDDSLGPHLSPGANESRLRRSQPCSVSRAAGHRPCAPRPRAPRGRHRLLRVAVIVAFGAIAWSAAIGCTRRRIIQ
jgi:uracil-DNA glycosylase